jgi:hypothetical protein
VYDVLSETPYPLPSANGVAVGEALETRETAIVGKFGCYEEADRRVTQCVRNAPPLPKHALGRAWSQYLFEEVRGEVRGHFCDRKGRIRTP